MKDDTHPPSSTLTIWDAARRDYLAGSTGTEVCARYGLGRSVFYARAHAGGWRRRDTAHGPPDHDLIEPPDRPPQPARLRQTMAAEAMDRADQALRLGRLNEVKGWLRVVKELRWFTCEEVGVATWREALTDQAEREIADAGVDAAWFEDEGWDEDEPEAPHAAAADDPPPAKAVTEGGPDSPDSFGESGSRADPAAPNARPDPATEPILDPRCGDSALAIPIEGGECRVAGDTPASDFAHPREAGVSKPAAPADRAPRPPAPHCP